jgi:predicted amidohydrolase YtcJ
MLKLFENITKINPKWDRRFRIEHAQHVHTINNAYPAFEEKEKGSIEPEKLADMVVLSDDILIIKPEKIQHVKVLMTIFDGKIVYEKK